MGKHFTQEEFLIELEKRNKKVFDKVIGIVAYEAKSVVIETIYGIIKVQKQEFLKVTDVPIKGAIDKTDFWVKRASSLRKDAKNIDYSDVVYLDNKHKVHIRCKIHNYNYSQQPSQHMKGVQGCAYCMKQTVMYTKSSIEAHKDFIEKIDGVLYILKLSSPEESFYKVGIVSKHRFGYRMNQLKQIYNVSVLYTEDNDMVSTFNLEQRFLDEFRYFKYVPKIKFIGYTECLTVNPVEHYYKLNN